VMLLLVGVGLVRTRRVWLRGPLADDDTRSGVMQPAGMLLAIAIFDAISLVFVLLTNPAGWSPSVLELLIWLGSAGLMLGAFVLLRHSNERGLLAAWGGTGARLVLTGILLGTTSAQHLLSVSLLLGIPMALALCSAITLFFWSERTGHLPAKRREAGVEKKTQENLLEKKESGVEDRGPTAKATKKGKKKKRSQSSS